MHRNWEQVGRDAKPNRWSSFHVTMNPKGDISLTRFALDMMETPEAVHLFFDKINHTIGLKPTRRVMADAYPVGRRGKHGGGVIRAFRLCEECGIRLNETVRFTVWNTAKAFC